MSEPIARTHLEEDISIHIFTVSASMLGVCLTVIGLLRVVLAFQKRDSLADDILAGDSVLFLVACLSSYCALRTRSRRRMHRMERFADVVFIIAMLIMVGACVVITYAVAIP
ncbi:MAG: hypothetical protein JWP89_767 [Schlesneria sp.]|nr:hypothetical protein [Schlesneria sp.]